MISYTDLMEINTHVLHVIHSSLENDANISKLPEDPFRI